MTLFWRVYRYDDPRRVNHDLDHVQVVNRYRRADWKPLTANADCGSPTAGQWIEAADDATFHRAAEVFATLRTELDHAASGASPSLSFAVTCSVMEPCATPAEQVAWLRKTLGWVGVVFYRAGTLEAYSDDRAMAMRITTSLVTTPRLGQSPLFSERITAVDLRVTLPPIS